MHTWLIDLHFVFSFSSSISERIYGTFMDVYAREGNITQLESMIEKMDSPNIVYYGLLIKAYGIQQRPDRGEEILHGMLHKENSRVRPTVDTFNELINAWASNPTIPDAPNRALAIIRYMDHNVLCKQLGIQPNTASFNTYLKCLAVSVSESTLQPESNNATSINKTSPFSQNQTVADNESLPISQNQPVTENMGLYVKKILLEMEERFRAGNRSVLPNVKTYNAAIQCCANVGETESALSLFQRMKNSRISPDIRAYNTMLAIYAQIGTGDSAQKAEEQITLLRHMSRTNPSVKPDVFSFLHLYKAWHKSGEAQSYDRIWMIYERMRAKKYDIQPNMLMYTFLIATLSSSPNEKHLECATEILADMEHNCRFDALVRPDARHYMPIINAYLSRIQSNKNRDSIHELFNGDDESNDTFNGKNIDMASKLFLRYMESYMHGRTGRDTPKEETIHEIVKGYIQTHKLVDGRAFLEKIKSYGSDTESSSSESPTKKKGYCKAPIQPSMECYQELGKAFLQSTTSATYTTDASANESC